MAVVTDAEAGLRALLRSPSVLQLRDPAAAARALEREAARLVVAAAPTPVLVNSRVDVALAAGAAGAHLPERDLAPAAARQLLGASRLLGRSVHSLAAALEAEAQGADYVIFGPVFATPSHAGQDPAGLDGLHTVAAAVTIPVLAIGGVDARRAEACRQAGAAGFAAIGYFG